MCQLGQNVRPCIPVCRWVCQLVKNGARTEVHVNPEAALNALVWHGAGLGIFLQHQKNTCSVHRVSDRLLELSWTNAEGWQVSGWKWQV